MYLYLFCCYIVVFDISVCKAYDVPLVSFLQGGHYGQTGASAAPPVGAVSKIAPGSAMVSLRIARVTAPRCRSATHTSAQVRVGRSLPLFKRPWLDIPPSVAWRCVFHGAWKSMSLKFVSRHYVEEFHVQPFYAAGTLYPESHCFSDSSQGGAVGGTFWCIEHAATWWLRRFTVVTLCVIDVDVCHMQLAVCV